MISLVFYILYVMHAIYIQRIFFLTSDFFVQIFYCCTGLTRKSCKQASFSMFLFFVELKPHVVTYGHLWQGLN